MEPTGSPSKTQLERRELRLRSLRLALVLTLQKPLGSRGCSTETVPREYESDRTTTWTGSLLRGIHPRPTTTVESLLRIIARFIKPEDILSG